MKKYALISFLLGTIPVLAIKTEITKAQEAPKYELDPTFIPAVKKPGQMFLLGETHGHRDCLDKEFEQWYVLYHTYGFRHLFVEQGYGGAQFLNLWMKSNNDEYLKLLERNWEQCKVLAKGHDVWDFHKKIKQWCPETVFHGTDVEHQYETTGKQYLKYLKTHKMKDSLEYKLALESIQQGKQYYAHIETYCTYRDDKRFENFQREFEALKGEPIVGFYPNPEGSYWFPSMADRLAKIYKKGVCVKNLPKKGEKLSDFLRIKRWPKQIFLLGETDYDACCFEVEFELWQIFYQQYGIRHLFMGMGYGMTQFLNLWMKSNGDEYLESLMKDFKAIMPDEICSYFVDFLKKVKKSCPKTVFHGTDIGHPYRATNERYLEYLKDHNLKHSIEYKCAQEAIDQWKRYDAYEDIHLEYRESKMFENFQREFEALGRKSILGIYGSFHIEYENGGGFVNMTNRLANIYKDCIHRKKLCK